MATTWYFAFLVLQVFLFYGISGSLLSSMTAILDHPSTLVDTLASKVPGNARFYMLFFLSKFVTALCADLFRVGDVVSHVMRRCVFGKALTPRDRRIARCGCHVLPFPAHRNLSALNGQMLLLFFVATTYAVIQPLIAPVACVFFALAYGVYARTLMAANTQRFDSGGTVWPRAYYCFVSALLTAQLTLMGLLGLKKGISQPSAVLLMFLATCFAAAMIDFRYRRLVYEVPLDVAAKVDHDTDVRERAAEAPASVWQYGMLTDDEPNFLSRRLHDDEEDDDDDDEEQEEEYVDGEMGYGEMGSGTTGGPRRRNGHGQQARAPLVYFSYEMPVMREPPMLSLPQHLNHISALDDDRTPFQMRESDPTAPPPPPPPLPPMAMAVAPPSDHSVDMDVGASAGLGLGLGLGLDDDDDDAFMHEPLLQ